MIKLIKSTFYKEEETKKALCEFIMEARQLSMGSQCLSFEEEFARWQKRKYCVMFNSGSSANLALIQALRNLLLLNKNDAVGFSAVTWATNTMPLIQHALRPIPIDVELSSLNVSPTTLKNTLRNTKIKALFLTNLLGLSDDIALIKQICAEDDILLVEDNCESLGSEYGGIKLGNFGLASTFSFFVGHHMSTIEGGAVCTDDEELHAALRMVRSHGWDRHLHADKQDQLRAAHNVDDFYTKYTFYDLAYNIRPTEIQGFLGRNQLQFLDETIMRREANFKALLPIYDNPLLEKIVSPMSVNSNFAFPVICKTEEIKQNYIKKSNDANIEIRPVVSGLMTTQPFYIKYMRNLPELPNARHIHQCGFYFGNNPELNNEEITTLLNTYI